MARDLKFLIQKVDGLYYPFSENKGADQLRGYHKADLRLCFRIYKNPVFSERGSNNFRKIIFQSEFNIFPMLILRPIAFMQRTKLCPFKISVKRMSFTNIFIMN